MKKRTKRKQQKRDIDVGQRILYGNIVSKNPRRTGLLTEIDTEPHTIRDHLVDIFDRPWIVYPVLIIAWAAIMTYALHLIGLV